MKLTLSFLSLVFISWSAIAGTTADSVQLNQLFKERLLLRDQLIPGITSPGDALKIKAEITDRRYEEDRLGEFLVGNHHRPLEEKSPPLFSSGQTVLLNPAFSKLEFQSGDVMILRGLSTISTTIASVADVSSSFSHSLTIYLNPADQKFYVIEALIDKGVTVTPLDVVLSEGVPKAVLYRHKNAALAAAAAKIDFDKATAALAAGHAIPYAKNLAFDGYDQITCAKLVRMGFDLASNGVVKMPSFPSTLGQKYPHIAAALGFPNAVIPVEWPADFDSEKDLQLVAESRDFEATLNFRIKDQIILSLLDWVEAGVVGHDFSKFSKGTPSQNESMNKMDVFARMANDVVNAVASKVLRANDQQVKKTGLNMSEKEIKQYMESIRQIPAVQNILGSSGFRPQPISCGRGLL